MSNEIRITGLKPQATDARRSLLRQTIGQLVNDFAANGFSVNAVWVDGSDTVNYGASLEKA